MTKLTTTGIIALLQHIADLKQEHFVCMTLDINYELIGKRTVFIGTLTGVLAHPREIFAGAIEDHAAAIVVAHNHPSNVTTPSRDDIKTTEQLVAAGLIMGIPVYDHIIITRDSFFSFRAAGMIELEG